jgi:ABC-2 type transport system ATP-binding protein
VALDQPARLKRQYGQRALKVEVETADGQIATHEVALDQNNTPQSVYELFNQERILTVHSEEATLEDIFVEITGRELVG